MTDEQKSIVFDLNGRGWVLLTRDPRSSSYREVKDIYMIDHQNALYRVNVLGQLHRMDEAQEFQISGGIIAK